MSFTPVPLFGDNDVADRERLNTIITNTNHLNDTKIDVRYEAYGRLETSGLKIAAGAVDSDSQTTFYRTRFVNVGNFFRTGTRPVAVVTLASTRARRSTIAIANLSGQSPTLDHTGFQSYARFIFETGNLPYGPNFVNWIMIGL